MWRTLLGAFQDLPAWQKAAIVATGVVVSPGLAMLAVVTGLSLFPFVLLGRFEGDAGETSVAHEVGKLAEHSRAHTEEVYAA